MASACSSSQICSFRASQRCRCPIRAGVPCAPRSFRRERHPRRNVVAEVSRAVTLLAKIGRGREDLLLQAFAHAFTERYGDREVPLLEALDEERGIGYDESVLPGASAAPPHDDPYRHAALLELIHRATSTASIEVALTPEDEEALRTSLTLPLPPTFNVVFTLAAASDDAANAGAFRIHPSGIVGPPGTRMMSRFWYADPEVERCIAADAATEQQSDPDAVFAELVYQPSKGLEGNILVRPRVRSHEIPHLRHAVRRCGADLPARPARAGERHLSPAALAARRADRAPAGHLGAQLRAAGHPVHSSLPRFDPMARRADRRRVELGQAR